MATYSLYNTRKSVKGALGKNASKVYGFSCTLGICASHYRVLHISVSCLLWMAIVGHPDSLLYWSVCM